jgi:hypothetical protein
MNYYSYKLAGQKSIQKFGYILVFTPDAEAYKSEKPRTRFDHLPSSVRSLIFPAKKLLIQSYRRELSSIREDVVHKSTIFKGELF